MWQDLHIQTGGLLLPRVDVIDFELDPESAAPVAGHPARYLHPPVSAAVAVIRQPNA
jgi:hypothetical protein